MKLSALPSVLLCFFAVEVSPFGASLGSVNAQCPSGQLTGNAYHNDMLNRAFAKFETEESLGVYLSNHPCAERVHKNLLWILDQKRELSLESTQGLLPGTLVPNRRLKAEMRSPIVEFDAVVDSRLWGIKETHAPEVWSVTQGEGVTVAVVDTGVDRNHEALTDRLLINGAEQSGKVGVDEDNNGYVDDVYGWDFYGNKSDNQDDQGHGSHVSGTIAGQLASKNFYGVAPKAKILAVKSHNQAGESREDAVVKGILYAADRGARVINCSWGGAPEAADFSQILYDAISYANQKGALLVAAAGNDSSDNDKKASYPANYDLPNVLSVAASTSSQKLAYFSNFGRTKVQISAPGQSIYSLKNKGGYLQESGTSMAAPHAAGAAALVFAKLIESKDSQITPAHVRQLLLENADSSVTYMNKISNGALDVSFLAKP
jgi:subtilisin family serine protease